MDGETLNRCPLRPLLDFPTSYYQFFNVYSWYKKGHFPDDGAWPDQAAAFVELVQTIDRAVSDAYAVKDKLDKSKAAKKMPTVKR